MNVAPFSDITLSGRLGNTVAAIFSWLPAEPSKNIPMSLHFHTYDLIFKLFDTYAFTRDPGFETFNFTADSARILIQRPARCPFFRLPVLSSTMSSRVGNPTVSVFEDRMAMLEGGVASVAAASGQSAITLTITAIAHSGDNIVTA
ncbi:hypothetical protein FB451DRAFT_1182713 [Mycena latifolia]|nr:hypothetical protein FB451DRAFT_1182713 [Mycena latifolia]